MRASRPASRPGSRASGRPSSSGAGAREQSPNPARHRARLEQNVRAFFKAYDINADGIISVEEFINGQSVLAGENGSRLDVQEEMSLFQDLAEGSAGVDFETFFEWQARTLSETVESQKEEIPVVQRATLQLMRRRDSQKPAAGTANAVTRQMRTGGRKELNELLEESLADPHSTTPAIDAEVKWIAQELRTLTRKRCASKTAAHKMGLDALKRSLTKRMRELVARRSQGKLCIEGKVCSRGKAIAGAAVELAVEGKCIAKTSTDDAGVFRHQAVANLGKKAVVAVQADGYAPNTLPVGGGGAKKVGVELLPLGVRGTLKAKAGSSGFETFKDPASGAEFKVPLGGLLKNGKAFTGLAEFAAAVVDVDSPSGVAAMPPPSAQTLSGTRLPIQSVGAVYADVRDQADGARLELQPEGECIGVTLPSRAPLPKDNVPCMWSYDEGSGTWQQSMEPLALGGQTLPPPLQHADETASPQPLDEREAVSGAYSFRKLLEQWWAERKPLDSRCCCGFMGKKAIIPVCRRLGLPETSDIPMRVFGQVGLGADERYFQVYPYEAEDDKRRSASSVLASAELGLAQIAKEVLEVLGNPNAHGFEVPAPDFYLGKARAALQPLRRVCDFLLDHATAVDKKSGQPCDCADHSVLQLTALETVMVRFLVGDRRFDYEEGEFDAGPDYRESGSQIARPSHHDFREALDNWSGNIPEAALALGHTQARKFHTIAPLREIMPVRVSEPDALRALAAHSGDVKAAAAMLKSEPKYRRAIKVAMLAELYWLNPSARPSNKEAEDALTAAKHDPKAAAKSLAGSGIFSDSGQEAKAREVFEEMKKKVEEANAASNLEFKISFPGWHNCDALYRAFSTVVGTLGEGLPVTRIRAVGVDYRSIEGTAEVPPDGVFSLTMLANARFEVHIYMADADAPEVFGPFTAGSWGVTNVGELPPLVSATSDNGEPEVSEVCVRMPEILVDVTSHEYCMCYEDEF